MHELLGLSFELQLVLVAGYLAYSIATIRGGHKDSTEQVILQVLTFGLFARLASGAVVLLLTQHKATAVLLGDWIESGILGGVLVLVLAMAAGMSWRKFLSRWCSAVMEFFKVYRDDHVGSTWMSIANADAKWNHVHVFLKSGTVLESCPAQLPEQLPLKPFTLNDDGIALYVTAVSDQAGELLPDDDFNNGAYSRVTFIPYAEIGRLDIGWLSNRT